MTFSRSVAAVLLAQAMGWVASTAPQDEATTEYKVKAAFLFNFARYGEWPESAFIDASSPFVVAVLGKDSFGAQLETAFKDKKIGNRPVEIRRYESLKELKMPHLLFVAGSEKENLAKLLEAVKGSAVLTVGDTESFARKGLTINLYPEENNVRFEVNTDAAARHKVTLSAKLLKLARIVHDDAKAGGK